jgi:hypothetical protein
MIIKMFDLERDHRDIKEKLVDAFRGVLEGGE